jgi:hypothetical protein
LTEITPNVGWNAGPYRLIAASNTVLKEWDEFAARLPVAAQETYERLTTFPLHHIPRRQFPQKGKRQKPYWEYEASSKDRVYYAVDLKAVTVYLAAVRGDTHTGAQVAKVIASRKASVASAQDK